MIETVRKIERNYKTALSYGMKQKGDRLKQSDENLAETERYGLYTVQDGVTTTIDKVAQAGWSGCAQKLEGQICVRIGGDFRVEYHKNVSGICLENTCGMRYESSKYGAAASISEIRISDSRIYSDYTGWSFQRMIHHRTRWI